MRIAQVAPLYEPVPPAMYGGTERVVSYLTEELVRRGHQVTLFASGDSRTSAVLRGVRPGALRGDPCRQDPVAFHLLELAQVFERAAEFDVIHCHVDYLAFPFARFVRTPTVHTLHGRLDLPHLVPVFDHFRGVPLVSVSDDQRRPLAHLRLPWVATVHHGLPMSCVAPGTGRGGYLAFLGRIAPEKRPDLAIEVAKRVGLPLRIAAKVDAVDQVYFDREIAPLLEHPLVEFVGEIDDTRKPGFLGDALALLFPVDWPEPFGLVMIEAMACGTPVIARPCGSVPEVIQDGVTGFLANTVDEMAEAAKRVDLIDRARCWLTARERFSAASMADRYEAVYRRLLPATAPLSHAA